MNLDSVKLNYVQKKNQFVLIDQKGRVYESDNTLITLHNYDRLPDLSVFMESISLELEELLVSEKLSYQAVTNPMGDLKGIYDIEIFHLPTSEDPRYLCVFSDQSEHYEFLRGIQQTRNEGSIENELLQEQATLIREKNKDTTDSIQYAKRIQQTILPSKDKMSSLLSEFFIIDRPRDIVGGDFYWIKKVQDKTIFAVVDCTGHGVPGAFMSIIAQNLLNRAVNEKGLIAPSDILSYLNKKVYGSFSHHGVNGIDGMDLAICQIDFDSNRIQYSGANIPLYLIQNGQLKVIKPTRQHIGMVDGSDSKNFANHLVPFNQGDLIYLTTDGYADQFGGPEGKKFSTKQLQDLLTDLDDCPLTQQKDILLKAHQDWKGSQVQVDDILLAGIKLNH